MANDGPTVAERPAQHERIVFRAPEPVNRQKGMLENSVMTILTAFMHKNAL